MLEYDLFKILQGGGDLATIALLIAFWKVDRRLLAVELKLEGVKSNVG
ncbi:MULTISPECIES: hypothetical protein [Thalassospira]|nr:MULTISPECIES: hypothetical protein [Thalassospira]MDM7975433.1 hypothetical protein [Thalassospira xiamenensis]